MPASVRPSSCSGRLESLLNFIFFPPKAKPMQKIFFRYDVIIRNLKDPYYQTPNVPALALANIVPIPAVELELSNTMHVKYIA